MVAPNSVMTSAQTGQAPHGAARLAAGLSQRELEASAIRASYIATIDREAVGALRCATCHRPIQEGERYREDRLREAVFGDFLASAICLECVAEGL